MRSFCRVAALGAACIAAGTALANDIEPAFPSATDAAMRSGKSSPLAAHALPATPSVVTASDTCPGDSLFSQLPDDPNADWTFGTSEIDVNGEELNRFESYSGVAGVITDLTFWGLDAVNPGLGFTECVELAAPFEIVFYADNGGAPGAVVDTFNVVPTRTPTGVFFAGTFEMNRYEVTLPNAVVQPSGWISIQGQGVNSCWFLWASSGGSTLGSSIFDDNGVIVNETFDLAMCVRGVLGGVNGACCNDTTAICTDNIDVADCTNPGDRFAANTLCADLVPACGEIVGACCFPDGSCTIDTETNCGNDGGSWLGANTNCAQCPCIVPCPPGATIEGEPVCSTDYDDTFNGGCNADVPVFSPISDGETVCGQSGTFVFNDPVDGPLNFRDTDWYEFTIGAETAVTWDVEAEFDVLIGIIAAPCPATTFIVSATAGECSPVSVTECLAPGTYYLFVAPSVFTGVPCGLDYTATVSTAACPTGACCFLDGSCEIRSEPSCLNDINALQYNGDGSDCGDPNDPNSNPCPQPLANDGCATATVITTLPYTDNLDNSFAFEGPPSGSCDKFSPTTGVMQNDVWWVYTADQDCILTITADTDGYDAVMTVRPDCSPTAPEIACSDQDLPPNNEREQIILLATTGTTYYIQVGDTGVSPFGGVTDLTVTCSPTNITGACCFGDGGCDDLNIIDCQTAGGRFQGDGTSCADPNLVCPLDAGEDCGASTMIPAVPFSVLFDNNAFTASPPAGSCNTASATVMQNDGWFDYTPTEDCLMTVTVDSDAGSPTYDGITAIYEGPDCNSLVEVTCLDEPEPMTATIGASAGTRYWFQIGDWGTAEGGGPTQFDLTCSPLTTTGACCFGDGSCQELNAVDCLNAGGDYQGDDTSCSDPNLVCPLAPGENCGIATEIPGVPFSVLFDNNNFAASPPPGSCNTASATVMQNDGWFKYTPADDCLLDVFVDSDAGSPTYDGITAIYEGPDCNSLVEVACLDEPEPMVAQIAATGGTTYWFQIGDWGTGEGGGPTQFDLDCVPAGATGACCFLDGSCQELNVVDCAAAGGDFLGAGTSCDPNNPCPQPPPGETCTNCIEVSSFPFATTIDTSDYLPGLPIGSCNSSTAADMDNDMWLCVTPTIDCDLTIDVDPTDYDGLTAVYTGADCMSLTEIACADEPEPHSIMIAATAGTTYYIQIGDWGSAPAGGITDISISCSVCGDLDGDGDVDVDDFNAFLAAFGSSSGDGNYRADADYDSNGVIDLVDYQLWTACYRDANRGAGVRGDLRRFRRALDFHRASAGTDLD